MSTSSPVVTVTSRAPGAAESGTTSVVTSDADDHLAIAEHAGGTDGAHARVYARFAGPEDYFIVGAALALGAAEGFAVGAAVGFAVGFAVGAAEPFGFAEPDGTALAATVAVGAAVASAVAFAVGSAVELPPSIRAASRASSWVFGPIG